MITLSDPPRRVAFLNGCCERIMEYADMADCDVFDYLFFYCFGGQFVLVDRQKTVARIAHGVVDGDGRNRHDASVSRFSGDHRDRVVGKNPLFLRHDPSNPSKRDCVEKKAIDRGCQRLINAQSHNSQFTFHKFGCIMRRDDDV